MSFKELLIAAKAGDKEAMEQLFLMYRPLLWKYSKIEGRFDEDLFQELSKNFVLCVRNFSMERFEPGEYRR